MTAEGAPCGATEPSSVARYLIARGEVAPHEVGVFAVTHSGWSIHSAYGGLSVSDHVFSRGEPKDGGRDENHKRAAEREAGEVGDAGGTDSADSSTDE